MVWFVSGKGADVRIGISESGSMEIFGDGKHEFTLAHNASVEATRQIAAAPVSWSIHCADAAEVDIDGTGTGLYKRVRSSLERTHGSIQFFSKAPAFLGVSLVLPSTHFMNALRLFEVVLAHRRLGFHLALEFLGFRVPEAAVDTPTADEFLDGRVYFFNGVSITARWE